MMTEHIAKPLPFFTAIKEIFLFYFHVFKYIIGLVILAGLVQVVISLLMPENPSVGLAIVILGALVNIFFYAWILYRADGILMNRSESTKDALHHAKKRYLPLIGMVGVYILLAGIIFLVGFGLQLLGNALNLTPLFGLLTAVIVAFVVILFMFTGPSIVIDQFSVFKSFEHSAQLVWGHWWRVFGIFFIVSIPIVVLSVAALWLPTRHIIAMTTYEFLYHIITYPLIISFVLVLYHDLKARYQMKGFKRLSDKSDNLS